MERILAVCENPGCMNFVEIKVGAKDQRRFCCNKCANQSNKSKTEHRRRKPGYKKVTDEEFKKMCGRRQTITRGKLMRAIVNLTGNDGGQFANLCNAILRGEIKLIE
jgi:hypothetical protein